MLRFSFLRSLASPVPLPEEHDQKLRRAFGRFAEERYRSDGARIVETYYGKNGCFHCDCRPDAERAPLLFLVTGNHIRREDKDGGKGTPHHDSCDFAYEAAEQKHLVRTWRPFRRNECLLKLVPDFNDVEAGRQGSGLSFVSTRSRSPKLARILFNLLHEAKLDRLFSKESVLSKYDKQAELVLRAACKYAVTPKISLLDCMATSLSEYYDLKKLLEAARSPQWSRPCGLFIETFTRIENKTLYPSRSYKKPIKVVGDLAVFGEKDNLRRAPYLVIGAMTFPTRDSHEVVLYNAYAHPCYESYRYLLVDSILERQTLGLLIQCRNKLAKSHGISIVIEKPLFDLGPAEDEIARDVCKPDFILRCQREKGKRVFVIIETMGYNDPVYLERKRRMRPLFEHIKGGSPPHAVIEHNRFHHGMSLEAVDTQFCKDVCAVVIEKCCAEG